VKFLFLHEVRGLGSGREKKKEFRYFLFQLVPYSLKPHLPTGLFKINIGNFDLNRAFAETVELMSCTLTRGLDCQNDFIQMKVRL
jgi:hypothetical protein